MEKNNPEFFITMDRRMTLVTKRDQVERTVVCLVLIDVVDV